MAEISAKRVAELRELTGLGMMACKKALVDAEGDIKKAEEILRIKSGDRVSKLAGRTAAEGAAAVSISADKKTGALVEVNCETDFVARDAGFVAFANQIAQAVAESGVTDVDALGGVKATQGETVEVLRKTIAAQLGENISIRRVVCYKTEGHLAAYLHGSKIGVIVELSGGREGLGRDIAMHIAASQPTYVSKDQVPLELVEQERKIYIAQAAEFGKTGELVAKMVEGRVNKYLTSVSLLSQPFVKNPDQTVADLLAAEGQAQVSRFTRFVVGEGIEKRQVDFAAEVAAVAKA